MFSYLDKIGFSAYYNKDIQRKDQNINSISLHFAFKFLTKTGFNFLRENYIIERWVWYIALISATLPLLLNIIGMFDFRLTPADRVKLIQFITVTLMVGIRLWPLILQSRDFKRILKNVENFWKIEELPQSLKNKYLKIFYFQNRLFQCCFIFIIVTAIGLTIKQAYGGSLFYIWTPFSKPWDEYVSLIVFTMHVIFALCSVCATDMIFVCNCLLIYIQLELLEKRAGAINYNVHNEDIRQHLNEFIIHHNYILRCIRHIDKTFTLYLFGIYCTTASFYMSIVIAFALFNISVFQMIPSLLYTGLQLSFCCIILEEITYKAANLCEAIYCAKWHENRGVFKKELVLMLLRSQKNFDFVAGGLVKMNRLTMIGIFKICFSLWTLLDTIKNHK